MIIDKIGQISIPVGDQQRALEFYVEKLGFQLESDSPFGEGERWIEVSIPGAETRMVLYAADAHKPLIGTFSPIMFSSPNLTRTAQALQERGVEIVQPLTTEFWGSYLIFKDPDGNSFLVGGPLEDAV
jgi:predicted enzyme related to lactoylglutathione lyase